MRSCFSRIGQCQVAGRPALILVALVWASFAFSCHRNDSGGCKICDAAGRGDVAAVEALLQGNPKLIFSKDDKGNTPLHLSASHGHRDVAELLLANRADVNARTYKGDTPLHWAAYNGHRDVTELLLANRADVNATDKYAQTPLIWCEQAHQIQARPHHFLRVCERELRRALDWAIAHSVKHRGFCPGAW